MKMKRPEPSKPIDSTVMRRLDALERLINDEYSGKPKVFEEKTGVKMAQVGQWFTGYRALRDKALRRLEETTGKPEGWFDAAQSITAALTAPMPTLQASGGPSPIAWGADLAAQLDSLQSLDARRAVYLECSGIIQRAKAAESSSAQPNQSSRNAA